jgi:subtilase family serine protease
VLSRETSLDYGNFMSVDDIQSLVAASRECASGVSTYLEAFGVSCKSTGDSLACKGRVAALEAAFVTPLHVFIHTTSGRRVVSHTASISLPDVVSVGCVEFVSGLGFFPPIRKETSRASVVSEQDYMVHACRRTALCCWVPADSVAALPLVR